MPNRQIEARYLARIAPLQTMLDALAKDGEAKS